MPANFPIQYQSSLRTGPGFNVNSFRADRDKAGILRTHDFEVVIPFPLVMGGSPDFVRSLTFSCDSINFPSTGPNISKVQRYSYGAVESRPTYPQFSDLQCTFMTDQYTKMYQFFHKWIQLIVNYDLEPNAGMSAYEISYKDEYSVDMYLHIYNPIGTLVRQVGFRQSFPTAVQDVMFSWSRRDEMVKIPVSFAFMDWHEVPLS